MDGIRTGGQQLFSEDNAQRVQEITHSIFVSDGMEIEQYLQGIISAKSFLNSVEAKIYPYQNGTRIEIDHGISTIGLIIIIIGLALGGVIGIVLLVIWYLKYDSIKSELKRVFPAYLPPPPHQNYMSGPMQQQ